MQNQRDNFNEMRYLRRIGASFFVSYLYHSYVDENHVAWQNVNSQDIRLNYINRSFDFYTYWLERILEMENHRLRRNSLNLTGDQVKSMAREVLVIIRRIEN